MAAISTSKEMIAHLFSFGKGDFWGDVCLARLLVRFGQALVRMAAWIEA
jgi:hypothetical protein